MCYADMRNYYLLRRFSFSGLLLLFCVLRAYFPFALLYPPILKQLVLR